MESSQPENHEDHAAGKGFTSMTHYNLVRKFFLCSKRWKFQMQKQQWTKNGKSSRRSQAWSLEEVESKKEVILEAQRRQKESPLCHTDGHVSSQERGVRTQITKIQWQRRAPWWYCKRWLWSVRSFYWTGLVCVPKDCRKSNGRYRKITRLRRTSCWRGILTQVKSEDAPRLLTIPKSECPDVWIRLPRHKWPKSWANIDDSVILLEWIWRSSMSRIVMGKTIRGSLLELGWDKVPTWECVFVHRRQGLFLSVFVDDI